ncbi:unnamed protein product, partial [Clonostachys chloroleuca]
MVYRFNDEQCSSLRLAAILCYPGIVQKLLNFGARVDVGALNAVVWRWYESLTDRSEKKDAKHQIIGTFLANGASADCKTLKKVLKHGLPTGSTLESLIRTIFREPHWEVFKDLKDGYFATVMKEYAWVQTLFFEFSEICQSMGCPDTCKSKYSGSFDGILTSFITNGKLENVSFLLDHIQPTIGSLTAAIRTKHFDIIEALLSKRIHINGDARCFENLTFDYHEDCDCAPLMDDMGSWCRPATPLAEAILWRNHEGSTALLRAIETGKIQTVKLLLDRGMNANRRAYRGLTRTPLQEACEKGDFEIIKLLLGKGADGNALPAMFEGATALQLAASSEVLE